MKRSGTAIPLVALALLLYGCGNERPGTVIARVGDSVLTLEEAAAEVDTTAGGAGYRLEQYVTAWVNSELIYQEARRLGLEEDPEYLSRLSRVRRQLANQVLLDLLIYRDTTVFSDDTLRAFFEKDTGEYALAEDHLHLNLITLGSREAARKFGRAVGTVKSWETVLDSVMADPGAAAEVVRSIPGTWYTPSTLHPPELWKLAGALGNGEVSFPFRTDAGYTVLQRLGFAPAGKVTEFALVRDEVLNRMRIEYRRGLFERLLGTLRERYSVEILLNTPTHHDSQDSTVVQ